MDFRGFDSSIILLVRGALPRPIGNSPESASQQILAGIVLVGRLGVLIPLYSTLLILISILTLIT